MEMEYLKGFKVNNTDLEYFLIKNNQEMYEYYLKHYSKYFPENILKIFAEKDMKRLTEQKLKILKYKNDEKEVKETNETKTETSPECEAGCQCSFVESHKEVQITPKEDPKR